MSAVGMSAAAHGRLRRAFASTLRECDPTQACRCALGCACPACGCGQASPPRRLSLAGEKPRDEFEREARTSFAFGHWLARSTKAIEKYPELVDFIDQTQDPYRASLEDVAGLLRAPDEWVPEGPDDYATWEGWFNGENGDLDEITDEFEEARGEFLTALIGAATHECNLAAPPIHPWPTTPGVYFVRAGDRLKIGKAKNVASRLAELQTSAPFKLELLAVSEGGLREEGELHRRFAHLRLVGEWFDFRGELLAHVIAIVAGAS